MSELAWQRWTLDPSLDEYYRGKGEEPYTDGYVADVLGRWAGHYLISAVSHGSRRSAEDRYDEARVWRGPWRAMFNCQKVEHGTLYATLDAAKAACQRHRDDRTDARLAAVFLAAAEGVSSREYPYEQIAVARAVEAAFRSIGEMFRKAGE